jgi:hypothetical protein
MIASAMAETLLRARPKPRLKNGFLLLFIFDFRHVLVAADCVRKSAERDSPLRNAVITGFEFAGCWSTCRWRWSR